MIHKNILMWLALAGVVIAVVSIVYDNRPPSIQAPVVSVPQTPYSTYLYGVGLVEASSGNIVIGTPVAGVIKSIYVVAGANVKAGDALFEIDDQDLQAQLITANAQVQMATASLVIPAEHLKNAESMMRRNPTSISVQDLSDLRNEYAQAEAVLALAKAQVEEINVDISRHTVRAPIDGSILQLKMRRGEYMDAGNSVVPALIIGNQERLFVRVDIDETEAWRMQPGAAATAYVRGNAEISIPLEFEYLEPYVIPKTAFTGLSTERTDRRVLQVIYGFARADQPVYVGQQLDISIQASAVTPERTGTAP
jgi:RND family efflux transporter MFP subunit